MAKQVLVHFWTGKLYLKHFRINRNDILNNFKIRLLDTVGLGGGGAAGAGGLGGLGGLGAGLGGIGGGVAGVGAAGGTAATVAGTTAVAGIKIKLN